MSVPQVEDTFRVNCFSCSTASRDMVASPFVRETGEGEGFSGNLVPAELATPHLPPAPCSGAAGNPLPLRRGEANTRWAPERKRTMFNLPKAMRGRIALRLRRSSRAKSSSSTEAGRQCEIKERFFSFRGSFRSARASSRRFSTLATPWAFFIGTFLFHIHVMRTIRVRCVSFFC
jgi:hypothetical protein